LSINSINDHFYISRIISDTSAHYIYGELVYEKGEFFPTDFYYANDLFFLRPHFMIALFRMLGMRGFENYALSCSALLATGVTLIAYTSLRLLDLSFRQASIIAILTFLPLGYSEYEFILAQQSHCHQIILTLLAALFLYAACREKRLSFVIPAGLGLSLLAWDSPLRALLLLGMPRPRSTTLRRLSKGANSTAWLAPPSKGTCTVAPSAC
jgi:hypothetical protein